jgi:hypothetical protein
VNDTEEQYWETLIRLVARITVALEQIAEDAHALKDIEAAQHAEPPR